MDWREQDGIVLPRVIQRLGDNAVFFRDDAKVIKQSVRAQEEAENAAAAAETAAEAEEESEPETVEIDASANDDDLDVRIVVAHVVADLLKAAQRREVRD